MNTDRKGHVARISGEIGERLKRFIRPRVRSEADADDLLQEVWEQLVTALEAGPIERVGAWLYTVARHRIIDYYRKPRAASLDAMAEEPDDESFGIPEILLRDDRTPATEQRRNFFWEQLHAALAELPQEQRQVFVWHEFEGLSFQEIAALTGENQNTLLARKRYAVLHLRRWFEPLREEFFP